jgi:hypothetical protein
MITDTDIPKWFHHSLALFSSMDFVAHKDLIRVRLIIHSSQQYENRRLRFRVGYLFTMFHTN